MRHVYIGSLALAIAFASLAAACVERVLPGEDLAARRANAANDDTTDDDDDGGAVSSSSSKKGSASSASNGGSNTGAASGTPGGGTDMPCDVQTLLNTKCVSCHANPPIAGSLSPLVTSADMKAMAKEDATKNETEVSIDKMKAGTMPPGGGATPAEIAALENWMKGNYAGTCAATGPDGGVAAPPPAAAVDPFANAPAYVKRTASRAHNAGKDCMGGCHNHGFTFAGTLRDGNGTAIAGAEVRLVDSNGKAILVNTDSSGNFHSSQSWSGTAHVGARTDTDKAIMVTALKPGDGGCNGCHANGGTVAPIHVP